MTAGRRAAVLLLALAPALLFAAAAAAQQQAVCPDPRVNPAAGNRVSCSKESTSSDDIVIRLEDFDIETTAHSHSGVLANQQGSGGASIDILGGSIETQDANGNGVYLNHGGSGGARATIRNAAIETAGQQAHGLYGKLFGAADLRLEAEGGSILTKGSGSAGVFGWAYQQGRDIHIDIRKTDIDTAGGAIGVYGWHQGTGDISIRVDGGAPVTTLGSFAHGVFGQHQGTGDISIRVDGGASVTTHGSFSYGVWGWHDNSDTTKDIRISLSGRSSVRTGGDDARGVHGRGNGTGGVAIGLSDSAAVATSGARAHGVHAEHLTGDGTMTVTVGAGASVRATGAGASGIQLGRLSSSDAIVRAADPDADGFRKQAATVHGTVRGGTGDAAGVYLAGGGRVYIGPQGTAGAASGVSVWARRELDTGNNADDPPALYVGLNPGGRTMAKVLDGGWILNDGGKTTIVMNGVKLHDGTAGATGLWAPNGARDVTIRKAGVTVTIPTSGPWTISQPSESIVADRDFSAADFTEVYAPRAAVYEALPGFLLRLDGGAGPAGTALAGTGPSGTAGKARAPGSPLWLRIGGGFGRYAARRAAVGARYRFRRWEAEAGMDFRLAEGVTGFASARLASGSARVSAATGGGRIEAAGYGLAAGAQWRGPQGWFAAGRLSAMRYSLDVESATRGPLKGGAGAWVFGYGAEMGKRFAAAGATRFAARAWAGGGQVSLDGFTDAVRARVSAPDGSRLSVGAEAASETVRKLDGGGELALRGAAGLALALDGRTAAEVSGAALRSKAPGARLLLGLGAEWRPRKDDAGTALGFDARTDGAGAKDAAYSLNLTLRTAF